MGSQIPFFGESSSQAHQRFAFALSTNAPDAAVIAADALAGLNEAQDLNDAKWPFAAKRAHLAFASGLSCYGVRYPFHHNTGHISNSIIPCENKNCNMTSGIICGVFKPSTKISLKIMCSLRLRRSKPLCAPTNVGCSKKTKL